MEETNDSMMESFEKPKDSTIKSIPSYWLTRIVLIRFTSFLYIVAFSVYLFHYEPLLGDGGVFPICSFLDRVKQHYGTDAFSEFPTLFWYDCSNDFQFLLGTSGKKNSFSLPFFP